jgi:hypothetical protein
MHPGWHCNNTRFWEDTTSVWQRTEGRIVALNRVLNDTAIEIDLDSRDDVQSALTYYGDIWQHMVASFAPLSGASQSATHPCG